MDWVTKMNGDLQHIELDVWAMSFYHTNVWPAPFAGFPWKARTDKLLKEAKEVVLPALRPQLPTCIQNSAIATLIAEYVHLPPKPVCPQILKLTRWFANKSSVFIDAEKAADLIAWNLQYWNINWLAFADASVPCAQQECAQQEADQPTTNSAEMHLDEEAGDAPLNIAKKRHLASYEQSTKKRARED
jgi:hypothetical protein